MFELAIQRLHLSHTLYCAHGCALTQNQPRNNVQAMAVPLLRSLAVIVKGSSFTILEVNRTWPEFK